MGTTSLSTAMVRTIKRGSTIGYYRSVTNRISSFTIEKILFWVDTWYRTALCLRGCDQLCSRKLRWVRRKMYSTECKRYPLSRIQPLSHRWFLIKDIKALVCPFAVLRSRFGLRYSRVRGRRQSKFLASSSTGGARNFYPYTGEPRFALRRATVMRTKILSVTPINPLGVTAPLLKKGSQENGVNATTCRRYTPSVFLPERAKKQLPLHRGAEKALRGLFCLRIKITSARSHRLWRGSESSLQRRQRIFHP